MLYGRQSIEREDSVSLDLQEHANREHCARADYDVVAVLTDPGISGRRWANRPGAVEAVRLIEAHEADVIVVWKWSRLSRRRLDLAVAFDRVETAGGQVESSTEPVDTRTASGKLARGMLSEIAAFTSDSIGEGWKEAHAGRRRVGLPSTGGDRYGYVRTRDGTGKVTGYAIDEGDDDRKSPAEALRLAYGWFVGGWGGNRIARELNARGYRNLHGHWFKQPQVYPMLDSGFAAGLVVHRPVENGHRRAPDYYPGAHPPIIDLQTWEAYLATRRARATVPPAQLGSRHPLSGFMRCGDCGAAMTIVSAAKPGQNSRTPATYSCNRWRQQGSDAALCVTMTKPRIERLVREWLAGMTVDIETAAAADRRLQRAQRQAETDAAAAVARVAEVNRALVDLELSPLRNRAPEAYRQAQDRLLSDLEEAQSTAEEAELEAQRQPAESRAVAGRLLRIWDSGQVPAEDIRAVLRTLLRGVWVYPTPGQAPSRPVIVPLWEPAPVIEWTPPDGR